MITDIKAWLDEYPTPDMIEQNPDGSDYIPIWIIEQLLDKLVWMIQEGSRQPCTWDRYCHKYAYHEIGDFMWLSTSFELKIGERILLCGSMIKLLDYPDNTNWIFTGISESTKAGVKVLGNKFGKSLNARTVLKNKNGVTKKPNIELLKPDPAMRKLHGQYLIEGNKEGLEKLESVYDFKIVI